jgi:hypothetical protein
MVSEAQTRDQNTKDQKGLRGCLILDIIINRIRKEKGRLKVDLGQDEPQQDQGVGGFSKGVQVGSNPQLGESDRSGTNPLRTIDTKGDGQGVESHGAISFDGLEIVDNGNAQTSDRVENRSVLLNE